MKNCPTDHELHDLLKDSLPDTVRTVMERHIELCPICQRQLEEITRWGGGSVGSTTRTAELAGKAASTAVTDVVPPFLARMGQQYPAEFEQRTRERIQFPGAATAQAPLGQVGDFEIIEELGSGSFGWVFRARERSLDRFVALKVLRPEMTVRPNALVRFEREARKASLRHDHIVTVYRFEKSAGFPPYLVMELVAGETLEKRLRQEGKLTPEAAVHVARQVALGLAAAHEQSMVHRDIKPANILLETATGRAKISDFGLARDIAGDSLAVTGTGEMAGTAPYMSPEHFQAPDKVDGRSDIFSLGVVLYEMLTGQLPFSGSFVQIRSAIMEDEPTPPRRLEGRIPADLETITLACLEKDPGRRYATAQALAEDLRRFSSGEPILCQPTGHVRRALKWASRKPAQASLVGALGLAALAVVALVVGMFWSARLQATNDELARAKEGLQDANGKLMEQQAYVRRLNYIADMNLAHQAWQNDDFRLLHDLLDAQDDAKLRGFEWHYLSSLASIDGRRIGPGDPVTSIAVDRQGRFLAFGVQVDKENKAQVQIWTTPSLEKPAGELVSTLQGQSRAVREVLFHPNKDWLITSDQEGGEGEAEGEGAGKINVWDYKQGKCTQTIAGSGPLAVSPDGRFLAFIRADGRVGRWDLTGQQPFSEGLELPAGEAVDDVGAMKPGAAKLGLWGTGDGDRGGKGAPAKGGKGEGAKVRKGEGERSPWGPRGEAKAKKGDVYYEVTQLAFSPDGKRLAAAGGSYKSSGFVVLWNLPDGRPIRLDGQQHKDLVTGVAFNPDGQTLAAVGFDHVLRVWEASTGKLRFRRLAHKLEVLSVSFNATGDRLATAGWDQTIKIWDARTGEELRNLRGSRGIVRQVLYCTPAGEKGEWGKKEAGDKEKKDKAKKGEWEMGNNLVSLNDQGEVRWWQSNQEQAARVFRHTAPVLSLAFSPKGRWLASVDRKSRLNIQDLSGGPGHELVSTGVDMRAIFTRGGESLLTLGNEGQLHEWHWAKGSYVPEGPRIMDSGKISLANQRVIVRNGNEFLVGPPHPVAAKAREDLASFGKFEGELAAFAVDEAGERLALAHRSGRIILCQRSSDNVVTVKDLREEDPSAPQINTLAFSPNGALLAAGNQDGSVYLWDSRFHGMRHHLTGHLCFISCLAFSPDGKRLASGSEDWTIKVWDVEVGRATLTLTGHQGRIRDLAFHPEGRSLASASEDGSVRLWPGAAAP